MIFPFSLLFLGLPFSCALDPFHMLLGQMGSNKQLDFWEHNVQHLLLKLQVQYKCSCKKRIFFFFCKVTSENMQLKLVKMLLDKMWDVTYWDLVHIYPHLSAGVGKSAGRPLKMASMDCSSSKYLTFSIFLNENFLLSLIPWQYLQYTWCWLTVAHIAEMFQGFVGVSMGCSSWIHGRRS